MDFCGISESAPEGWQDVLDEQHIQWVESPLHDKDMNADGTPKKPHWHILLLFDGKKSYEQVKELTDKLHATIPQKCASAKGLVRYMAHLDNPEKVQYDKGAIIGHGGIDVAEYLKADKLIKVSAHRRDDGLCKRAEYYRVRGFGILRKNGTL